MSDLTRGQKIRLGVFFGTGVAILAAATVIIAGRAWTEKRDEYRIRFSSKAASFSGLSVGSDVTYSGIKIGRVERLAVASDDVSVIAVGISVSGGTPIAVDSTASLGSQGITGMKFIDISRGSPKVRLRKPGDEIPAGDSLLDSLSERAASIGQKLDELLSNLQGMTGPGARGSVEKILSESAALLADNRGNITAILGNARIASEELALMARSGNQLLVRADRLLVDLGGATAEMRRAVAPGSEVDKTVVKVARLVDALHLVVMRSQGDLDVTLRHLRNASADVADFSQAIKENPTLLMFSGDRSSDARIGK